MRAEAAKKPTSCVAAGKKEKTHFEAKFFPSAVGDPRYWFQWFWRTHSIPPSFLSLKIPYLACHFAMRNRLYIVAPCHNESIYCFFFHLSLVHFRCPCRRRCIGDIALLLNALRSAIFDVGGTLCSAHFSSRCGLTNPRSSSIPRLQSCSPAPNLCR